MFPCIHVFPIRARGQAPRRRSRHARPARRDGPGHERRGASAQARLHDDDAGQRAAGGVPRRPLDADRAYGDLVPRRLEEREARSHRLCPPVRAHDVQGLEERRAGRPPVVHLERGRPEQRLHQRGFDRLLGDDAGAVPAARAVARGGPHGVAADRRAGVQDRARGRQGRAADAGREPAVRPPATRSSTTRRSRFTPTSTRRSAA